MVHQAITASGSKWVHSGAKWRKYYPSKLEISCREKNFVDVRGQRSAWEQWWETTRKATGSPRSTDHKQTDHSCVIKRTHKINPLRTMQLRLTTQPPLPSYSREEHPEPCATCRGQSPGSPDSSFQSNYYPSGLLQAMRSFVGSGRQQQSQHTRQTL